MYMLPKQLYNKRLWDCVPYTSLESAMHRTRVSCWKLTLGLLTILATGLPGCGTTRPMQEQGYLLEQRRTDSEHYLSQTEERYRALLQGLKAQYDEYIAGRHPGAPVLDYLIISGGGDWGAFGAGILKGWGKVPQSEPLARPRFHVVTGVSTGALIAPFAYLGDDASIERIVSLYRNPQSVSDHGVNSLKINGLIS